MGAFVGVTNLSSGVSGLVRQVVCCPMLGMLAGCAVLKQPPPPPRNLVAHHAHTLQTTPLQVMM